MLLVLMVLMSWKLATPQKVTGTVHDMNCATVRPVQTPVARRNGICRRRWIFPVVFPSALTGTSHPLRSVFFFFWKYFKVLFISFPHTRAMLRSRLAACPLCEVRSLLPRLPPRAAPVQWPQQRSYQTATRRKPSRMALSDDVSKSFSKPTAQPRRKSLDPFAHLNQQKPPRLPTPRTRNAKAQTLRGEDPQLRAERRSNKREKGHQKNKELFHAMKMQRALSTVPYGQRQKVKSKIMEIDSFDEYPLLPVVKSAIATQALPGLSDIGPTPVQRVTFPALLGSESHGGRKRGKNETMNRPEQFLVAAETGSGKTLSYLVPIIDAMKRNEAMEKAQREAEAEEEAKRKELSKANSIFEVDAPEVVVPVKDTARPRVIILVPTAELVTQVGAVAKSLSHLVKFKAALISSAYTPTVIRNRLFAPSGVDMLISTPHLLASLSESSPHILSRVTHLVIDEADSLLDRSFAPLVEPIIARSTPSLQQLILCSATIPRSLDNYLRDHYPDIQRLVTPNLHAIPRRVQLGVVDVEKDPYRGNKNLACADTIWSIGRSATEHESVVSKETVDLKRIIVFVNEREKAVEVAEFLATKGIDAMALNRDTDAARKDAVLASFRAPTAEEADKVMRDALGPNYIPPHEAAKGKTRRLINAKVIVCTDLGSRGIDTLACRHVVLYDVPHTSIDFIHRLGRTGRMGRRGRGIVLVGRGDRKDIVREVREAMFKGQAMI